ncbi:MAG: hypothetical protein IJT98_06175 [Prevotella sp.]|nr:hypothetical protein [Prevotella sp.]
MKKIIVVLIFVFFTGSYVSCDNNSDDSVEILRKRTENAKMIEYVDSTYGARLFYPDFFKIDSVGKSYASFSYSDENIKDLRLSFSIYPPRLIEKSKEYVRRNTDSLTTFSKVKSGSLVMTEEYEYFPQIKCVFKFYKTQHGWTSFCLTYEKQYEEAVERLIKMTKDWKIYDEDTPKWFCDMCDFLDI